MIEDASSILENIIANDNDSVGLWRRVVLTLKVAFEHDQDGKSIESSLFGLS